MPEKGKNLVFIAWSGDIAKRLAEGLSRTILGILDTFVSSQDVTTGAPWLNELDKNLAEASFTVACLVPGSSRQPWINFEGGYAYAKRTNFKLIRFGEE